MAQPATTADLLGAMIAAQIAILTGMVEAKIVDPRQMRDWLQGVVNDLNASEQSLILATCLRSVITQLEKRYLSITAPPRPN